MVKHIVFWNLAEHADGRSKCENGQMMKEKLESLVGVVPGLLKAEVGVGFNESGYDLCLYSELEDMQSLDVYQNHPAHLAVKEFVHKVITERTCCDYNV